MFESVRATMDAILASHPWSGELAGILPLSAVIDFLDVPRTLHTFQLTGNQPLWCWSITPSASRLLLSNRKAQNNCYLDDFGASLSPLCLDGRYGDLYHMASPETLRLYLETLKSKKIRNNHKNMSEPDRRIQNLEVIHMHRTEQSSRSGFSLYFLVAHVMGWVFFLGLFALSVALHCYITLGFLATIILSGAVVYFIHGSERRNFQPRGGSEYNRVIITAMHMNETNWQVFYGESSVLNSVLNNPFLSTKGPTGTPGVLRFVLRLCIISQWGFAIGAATLKGWDSYFITFWIMFCIFWHTYPFAPEKIVKNWMEGYAGVRMDRYEVQLASRRAMLNTIIALNPDTFKFDEAMEKDTTVFCDGAFRWIDPILKESEDRAQWEESTRLAMIKARPSSGDRSGHSSEIINEGHEESSAAGTSIKINKQAHWYTKILEGIEVAAKIRDEAGTFGRRLI
jgi:hypothetical protein